jgi:serine/threonine protein phosphatase PrpC
VCGRAQDSLSHCVRVDVGRASDIGLVRTSNEDSLLTMELHVGADADLLGLYAVADGMGGHKGGQIASSLATRSLAAGVIDSLLQQSTGRNHSELALETISRLLKGAMKRANRDVCAQAEALGNEMGTTLSSVLIAGDTAHIANVGDSRVYLLDGREIRRVTTDHSLVASLVTAGELAPEQVYVHPRRNVITRSLGTGPYVEVDLFTEPLKPGNTLLLCSDGLWEMVRDNQIRDVLLEAENAVTACRQLIETANHNGGRDNISVIVVKVNRLEKGSARRSEA